MTTARVEDLEDRLNAAVDGLAHMEERLSEAINRALQAERTLANLASHMTSAFATRVNARVEDLEESLRRIVTVIGHDPQHDRDDAVLAIALEVLGLDPPA